MGNSLEQFLSAVLFVAVLGVAGFLLLYSIVGIGSTVITPERATILGFAGVALALAFIGIELSLLRIEKSAPHM